MKSEYVSGNYFAMFGIGPYAGRVFTPDDDRKGASPVTVLSYRAWQQKFGADRSIVGSSVTMNGQPFTVAGIAPPGFFGDRLDNPAAFWIPIADEPLISGANSILDFPQQDWLDIIGRIAPDADPKQIEAHLQVELQQWLRSPIAKLQPGEAALVSKQTLHLSPGGAGVQELREEYESGLHLLMWISALVLAIACANVANLMLVRATNRKLQTSIRAALGAPPSRQIRQVFTESLLLAALGGIAGVALAFAGTRIILHLAFQESYVAIHASPSVARPRLHILRSHAHRSFVRRGPGMDHRQDRSRRCPARLGAFHQAKQRLDAKVAGRGAGISVTRATVRRGITHAELA